MGKLRVFAGRFSSNPLGKELHNPAVSMIRDMSEKELFRRLCKYFTEDEVFAILDATEIAAKLGKYYINTDGSIIIQPFMPHVGLNGKVIPANYNVYGDYHQFPELFKKLPKSRKIEEPIEVLYGLTFHDGSRLTTEQAKYICGIVEKNQRMADEELVYKLISELMFLYDVNLEEVDMDKEKQKLLVDLTADIIGSKSSQVDSQDEPAMVAKNSE